MSKTIAPIVVMGVSGSGKTTIGRLLAAKVGLPKQTSSYLHSISKRHPLK